MVENHGGNRRNGEYRTTDFDNDAAQAFLEQLREGISADQIRRIDDKAPTANTIWHWCHERLGAPSGFKDEYHAARLEQANRYAEQVIIIADSLDEHVRRNVELELEALGDDATPIDRARAKLAAKRRSVDAAKEQIKARKWASGRMHPNAWGDRVSVQLETDSKKPPTINFSNLTNEQLEKLVALEGELSSTGE